MTPVRLVLVAALCALIVPELAHAAKGPAASVNGVDISRTEVDQALRALNARMRRRGTKPTKAQKEATTRVVLRSQLQKEIIRQAAEREKVKVSDKALNAMLEDRRKDFNHAKGFTAFLQATGKTEQDVKASLEERLVIDQLVKKYFKETPPTRADAKKELENNRDAYMIPAQARLAQIFLRYPDEANFAAKDEVRRRASGILRQAQKDPKKFFDLAKRYSDGPTAADGGSLGMVRRGRMSPEVDAAVEGKKVGDLVGPVETAFGVHVFLVEELRGSHQGKVGDWEQVIYQSMKAKWKQRTHKKLLKKLYQEGKVVVHEPGITFTAESFASMGTRNTDRRRR